MKPLLTLLQTDPAQVDSLSVEQVVALCVNGKLADNSQCSIELREYLQIAKSENLRKYVQTCLQSSFDRSGLVLQDIVNEFGRRIDYTVENGLYQGKVNAVGYDGLWAECGGHHIVVEVKTTDAYWINLDTVARYRDLPSTGAAVSTLTSADSSSGAQANSILGVYAYLYGSVGTTQQTQTAVQTIDGTTTSQTLTCFGETYSLAAGQSLFQVRGGLYGSGATSGNAVGTATITVTGYLVRPNQTPPTAVISPVSQG